MRNRKPLKTETNNSVQILYDQMASLLCFLLKFSFTGEEFPVRYIKQYNILYVIIINIDVF